MTENVPDPVSREVFVPAHPETVWSFVATDEGWSAWWGAGSTIDPTPGGAMTIAFPDGRSAVGTVLAVKPAEALSLSWGYPREDAPIPVDGSTVEITLRPAPEGTVVRVEHHIRDVAARREHVAGWRYELGLLRTAVVGATLTGRLAGTIDAWHAAWAVDDPADRRAALAAAATDEVVVDEPMAVLSGVDDLDGWIAQARVHLPATVRRTGPPALCGALTTWDWEILAGDAVLATGRSVGRLAPDGRLAAVTGFWLTAPRGVPTSVVPTG